MNAADGLSGRLPTDCSIDSSAYASSVQDETRLSSVNLIRRLESLTIDSERPRVPLIQLPFEGGHSEPFHYGQSYSQSFGQQSRYPANSTAGSIDSADTRVPSQRSHDFNESSGNSYHTPQTRKPFSCWFPKNNYNRYLYVYNSCTNRPGFHEIKRLK
jgi:hypothetical protein